MSWQSALTSALKRVRRRPPVRDCSIPSAPLSDRSCLPWALVSIRGLFLTTGGKARPFPLSSIVSPFHGLMSLPSSLGWFPFLRFVLVAVCPDRVAPRLGCEQEVLPLVLRMASDPVPNIRFNVSKTLEKMAPRLEVWVWVIVPRRLPFSLQNVVAFWSSQASIQVRPAEPVLRRRPELDECLPLHDRTYLFRAARSGSWLPVPVFSVMPSPTHPTCLSAERRRGGADSAGARQLGRRLWPRRAVLFQKSHADSVSDGVMMVWGERASGWFDPLTAPSCAVGRHPLVTSTIARKGAVFFGTWWNDHGSSCFLSILVLEMLWWAGRAPSGPAFSSLELNNGSCPCAGGWTASFHPPLPCIASRFLLGVLRSQPGLFGGS